MLWPEDKLGVAFSQIKVSAEADPHSTLILASAEPDSVCAVKIVADLLKSESIAYSTKAVPNFEEAETFLKTAFGEGGIRSVILINCGGTVDLTKRFGDFLEDEGTFMYVIDSHRPLSHANLHESSSQVIVFGGEIDSIDSGVPENEDPDIEDALEFESEDEDERSQHPENDQPNEASRASLDQEDEAFKELGSSSPQDSPRRRPEEDSPRKKRMRRDRVLNYYARTYIGDPASHVAFNLAQQVKRPSNFNSWVALVGIASRYLAMEIDDDVYLLLVSMYRDIVLDSNTRRRPQLNLIGDNIKVPNPLREHIDFVENELRLTLYRHWSLQEACYNTCHFASRFGLWSPDLDGDLPRVFAKMGLSVQDTKQKFGFMSPQNKVKVKEDLARELRTGYEYKRLTYPSFVFRPGFGTELSADDMARAISALLFERPRPSTSGDTDGSSDPSSRLEEGFTKAYKLLNSLRDDSAMSKRAIDVAMLHARLLSHETISIIQGGMVQSAGDFRFVTIDLNDESEENLNDEENERTNYFSNPSSVVLLARSVINAQQGALRWLRNNGKPLVLAVTRQGQTMLVGVPCPSEPGEVVQNPFGRLFQKTAAELGLASSPHQFLDQFVIQIPGGDIQRFLATLSEFFRV